MGIKFSQLPVTSVSSVSADDYIAILNTSDSIVKRMPADHSTDNTSFGLGTLNKYGHVKVIDNIYRDNFADGEALSAHQGNMIANNLGQIESNVVASHAHNIGDHFIFQGKFVRCIANIEVGADIVIGYNVELTTISNELNIIYPVGSIYLSIGVDPNNIFPGTWVRQTGGILYMAADGSREGSSVGSDTKTLIEANLPSHSHSLSSITATTSNANYYSGEPHPRINDGSNWVCAGSCSISGTAGSQSVYKVYTSGDGAQALRGNGCLSGSYNHNHSVTISGTIGNTGSGTAFDVKQKGLSVGVWLRTA